jgi:glutathione synthase/RimK-type ligase-like ATP-grasp enzyme
VILIIASPGDRHAEAVVSELDRLHVDARILDMGLFPYRVALCAEYGYGQARTFSLTTSDGTIIPLSECRAIWWRRPRVPTIAPDIRQPSHRRFAHEESYDAIMGTFSSLDTFWVNDPVSERVAHHKVFQLQVAQDVGLPVPRTLITNDPAPVHTFVEELGPERIIYKTFSATRDEWRETRVLRPDELDLLDSVRYAPVIFQEYIPLDIDLRVTIIGDETLAAAIYSGETGYDVDYRVGLERARVEPVMLPEEVERCLHAFMRRLGLVYGAIDMRRTPDGSYVFLEVNPSGEFLFIEKLTAQPLAANLAQLLAARDFEMERTSR